MDEGAALLNNAIYLYHLDISKVFFCHYQLPQINQCHIHKMAHIPEV